MYSKKPMQSLNERGNVAKKGNGLDKAINTIQDAISNKSSGQNLNIAILSLPYGGRSELVDEIIDLYPHEVNRTIFSSITDSNRSLSLPERKGKIMIFDNCHYQYTRKIGGFEQIEGFLNKISSYDAGICITTWNIHSWNYLVQVLDIDKYFSLQVTVPSLDQDEIKDLLVSGSNKDIQFVNDSEEPDGKLRHFLKKSFMKKLTNKKFNLYTFHMLISDLIHVIKGGNDMDPESMILKEITKRSYGDSEIAKEIWHEWIDGNTVRTSNIKKAYVDIDLDDMGRFVLFLLIATEYITKEEIVDVINSEDNNKYLLMNKALFHLSGIGVITKNNGYYSIRPENIYSVIKYLESIRLVW